MLRLAICATLLLAACDVNQTSPADVEDLLLHTKVVVDKRWSPPICFLAHSMYATYGGPVLTTVPCESVMNSGQEIIMIERRPTSACLQCSSGKCWPAPNCRKVEEMK